MRKFFAGTPWGIGTPPENGGNHPEASLGESPERTASSVGSGHKSRVMEPRKIAIAGAFAFMPAGAAPERQTPRATVSSRGLRAGQMCARVPWELGRSSGLLFDSARQRTTLAHERPGIPETA